MPLIYLIQSLKWQCSFLHSVGLCKQSCTISTSETQALTTPHPVESVSSKGLTQFGFHWLWWSLGSRWLSGKESAYNAGDPGSIPWRRKWQPTPVSLPGRSHGWRSLAGYSPLSRRWVGHNLVTKQPPPSLAYVNNNTTKQQQQLLKKKKQSTSNNIYLNCLIGFFRGSKWDRCMCILKSIERNC